MLNIPRSVYDQIVAHSKEAYPHECCGFLVGKSSSEKTVAEAHRAENANKERANDRYIIDPKDINRTDKLARAKGLDIIGFYHSHPDHPDRPSQFDRDMGQAGYSYVIIAVRNGTDISVKSWSFDDEGEPFREEAFRVE